MRYLPSTIAATELAHFLFGSCVSLAVALLACALIWITYRYIFSAFAGYRYPLTSSTLVRAGFYILLCSLSAALFSHVLEDYFLGWF